MILVDIQNHNLNVRSALIPSYQIETSSFFLESTACIWFADTFFVNNIYAWREKRLIEYVK